MKQILQLQICLFLSLLCGACAGISGFPPAHTFYFNAREFTPGTEIVDIEYGEMFGKKMGFWSTKRQHEMTYMPVPEILRVKWRNNVGETYEASTPILKFIPSDINFNTVAFLIDGKFLTAFFVRGKLHAPGAPDCPVPRYSDYECVQLGVRAQGKPVQ